MSVAWAVRRLLGSTEEPFSTDPFAGFEQTTREGLLGLLLDSVLQERRQLEPEHKQLLIERVSWEMRCLYGLGQVGREAQRLGIEVLTFKGCALTKVYPRPGMRAFGDIDLCVRAQDRERFEQLLKEMGFRGNPASCVYSQEGLSIDLHTHPLHQLARAIVPADDDWWQRATLLSDKTGPVLCLDTAHEFILSLFHAAKHAFSRANWVVDIALLASRISDGELSRIITAYRAQSHIYYAQVCMRSWFGCGFSPSIEKMARPPVAWNLPAKHFVRLVLARRAPDFLGMLTPISALPGSRQKFRYLAEALFPEEIPKRQRLQQLLELMRFALTLR